MFASCYEYSIRDEVVSDVYGSREWQLPVVFSLKRHKEKIIATQVDGLNQSWRLKERMKTVSVALVMCLNVGVDPPDVIKTQPCARLECWFDPVSLSSQKALETIGANLQKQYERWQPRARYKQSLDPTVEDVKKLCTSLRRNAKEERVLFHYTGHGVPKPTVNGEIWVFNKSYTQYIPLSIYDLQMWMGSPSIYVYDCSNAGTIVDLFQQFANQHEQEYKQVQGSGKASSNDSFGQQPPNYKNCIQLAACGASQILPMNSELPADLFTSCLTTPIKIALRWYVMQNTAKLVPGITLEMIDKIPGQLNDRRTIMGELNWIFTAITDTIAWNTLPRDLFQKLFRQDLLVASLFRNFLLAERIMRSYNCSPVSSPKLPPTYQHPMWLAWDLALDICLSQLPSIVERNEPFQHSPFFAEQLTAFQVWLEFGSELRNPPEQLPIVLQVLLSQVHRLRALDLLGRFLDLGPWAVNLALSVGIFPYVLKLLQSSARELRPLLVFIWAKILSVDNSCQVDLIRENGHKYFLSVLEDATMPSQHRMLAAFVLACIVKNYPSGQEVAVVGNVISSCLEQLNDSCAHMRKWLAICLGRVWSKYEVARGCGVRDSAHEKLYALLSDDFDECPEVRAAVVYALGTFIWSSEERTDHANTINHSIGIKLLISILHDGSPLVRKELVVALQYLVLQFESQFVAVACQFMEEERSHDYSHSPQSLVSSGGWTASPPGMNSSVDGSPVGGDGMSPSSKVRRIMSISSVSGGGQMSSSYPVGIPYGSIYVKIWLGLVTLSSDPYVEVSEMARTVLGAVKAKVQSISQPREVVDARSLSSFSAPSSPSNKSSFPSGESPPANMTMSQRDVTNSSGISGRSFMSRGKRLYVPNTIQEDSIESSRASLVSTEFVDWCSDYLAQPMMMFVDEVDTENSSFSEQEWRCLRNAKIRKEAEAEQRRAANMRLDNQVFINRNPSIPTVMRFHPYEPHVAVADKEYCSIWDWEQGLKLSYFSNINQQLTRITSMDFLNAHEHALLMIGTDDGAVKIWRNYEAMDGREPEVVTAWQALTDMLPSTRGAGLVLEWEQDSCLLFASGDVRILRIWDCERERWINDISTGADSCVTSISLNHQQFVCGFGDGSVRMYDRRVPNDCRVGIFREHSGWVVNVHYCKQGDFANKIISGSVAGDVKIWEPRTNSSVKTYQTSHAMTAMSVHPAADIFACGSVAQFITIYTYHGDNLSLIKYHDGFMGQRIGPISSLTFHPFKINLAAGSTDSIISVYAADQRY